MPAAARVTDLTNHGGTIVGPGVPNVFVGGMPAAVVGDQHICVIPPNTGHITASAFVAGSGTVFIGGLPALRTGDACLCGAAAAVGMPTVSIGG
ncbi:MAG: PaaR repeat-containing protein [Bacteroidetes bacterium]|nr:MAG: PaaR repeat-containing protein [Bacteroidota bacterium]